jgi:hypothetical protein
MFGISLDRLLSVPQIDLSARVDRKMVIFYVYLHYFTKKARENNRSKKMTGCLLWIMVYYVYAFQPQSQKITNNTAALGLI